MASERPNSKSDTPREPPDWRRLRLWHIQPVRDILVLALIFGLLYLGYVLRSITVPMLLALLLAYLFEPLVKKLTRSRYISRPGAALGIIAAFILIGVVPLLVGVGVGVAQAAGLVSNVASNSQKLVTAVTGETPEIRENAVNTLPPAWQHLGEEMQRFRTELVQERRKQSESAERRAENDAAAREEAPPREPQEPASRPSGADHAASPEEQESQQTAALKGWRAMVYPAAFTAIEWTRANADSLAKSLGETAIVTGQGAIATGVAFFGTVALLGFGVFLTAFFFFFFSTGWGRVLDFWAGLIPERKKGVAFDLIAKMDRVIAGFVRGRLTICAIMGILHTLAYWLIGVPVPFIIGPIAGLLYIVPFLHILTIPVGIILLWLQPSSIEWQNTWWWIIFAPIGVDVAGQFLDDWILSPMIQGKTTEMDAPTILFASMAGGALAGMYGLLVAIPVAACIRILVKELFWPKFQRWARGQERDFLPISSEESARAARRGG